MLWTSRKYVAHRSTGTGSADFQRETLNNAVLNLRTYIDEVNQKTEGEKGMHRTAVRLARGRSASKKRAK